MSTTTNATNERDANGQFAKGNSGGPGNPYARRVTELRQRMLARVTDKDLDDVVDVLIALAKTGNLQAIKILLSYTLGKPVEQPHPDRVDLDEFDAFRINSMNQHAFEMIEATPIAEVNKVLRRSFPYRGKLFRSRLLAALNEMNERDAKRDQATVIKRNSQGQTKSPSVPKDVADSESETIRIVNDPDPEPTPTMRQAANKSHS